MALILPHFKIINIISRMRIERVGLIFIRILDKSLQTFSRPQILSQTLYCISVRQISRQTSHDHLELVLR